MLQHLDSAGTYTRVLFVHFSSAFNTIVPELLQVKLSQLSVPDPICRWIMDFLTNRRQQVWLGKHTLDPQTLSTGVLSTGVPVVCSHPLSSVSYLQPPPPKFQWLCGFHCGATQIPGRYHFQGLGEEHSLHSQENTAENVLPETTEDIQPAWWSSSTQRSSSPSSHQP